MRIPRYWSRLRQFVNDSKNHPLDLEIIAGSLESPEDAALAVRRKRDALVQRLSGGGGLGDPYPYGVGEMREEIKDELIDEKSGQTQAIITRNSYGSLVLNAASAMFVDIDIDLPQGRGLWAAIKACFGSRERAGGKAGESAELRAIERVKVFCQNYSAWGFRVYRTRAGLRLLATHELFDPKADQTLKVMRDLDCDPLYLKLCRSQDSFRARLTPKPWRTGMNERPPEPFPWRDAKAEARHRAWERDYERRIENFKTCEFVGAFGAQGIHPEVAPIVHVHDAYTCKTNTVALA